MADFLDRVVLLTNSSFSVDPASPWTRRCSADPKLRYRLFPEYPSGHSVQSGAAFQVLTDLFGDHYAFDDHSHDARGLPTRHFASFAAAGAEAAISRLYGGIHFRPAIELGLMQGRCIGQAVSDLPFLARRQDHL